MPFRNEAFISKRIGEFIQRLVSNYKATLEIWLFGSRAQGKKTANDWDLLVVTMDQGPTLSLTQKNPRLKDEAEQQKIHLFIQGNDEDPLGDYFCPWEGKVSQARDKFNLRNKITWVDPFEFQYTGDHGENHGRCVWDREGGIDSILHFHYLR